MIQTPSTQNIKWIGKKIQEDKKKVNVLSGTTEKKKRSMLDGWKEGGKKGRGRQSLFRSDQVRAAWRGVRRQKGTAISEAKAVMKTTRVRMKIIRAMMIISIPVVGLWYKK